MILDVDNRTAKKINLKVERVGGEPDNKLLGELLEDLNSEEVVTVDEIREMGFEEDEFSKFLHMANPPAVNTDDVPVFGRSVTLSLEFKDVRERDAVKAKLLERSALENKTTGEVVLRLLERAEEVIPWGSRGRCSRGTFVVCFARWNLNHSADVSRTPPMVSASWGTGGITRSRR